MRLEEGDKEMERQRRIADEGEEKIKERKVLLKMGRRR